MPQAPMRSPQRPTSGRVRSLRAIVLTLILYASACDDPVALTLDLVAGSYEATEFTADGQDILAAGGTLDMVLSPDGTVSGELDLPASAGGPFTADLAGTFSVSGDGLTFTQGADTFVRDASWSWDDGALRGEWSNTTSEVSVRMQRQ